MPELRDAAQGADLLVFVVPHQFIRKLCDEMAGCVSKTACGITLIKVKCIIPVNIVLILDRHNEMEELLFFFWLLLLGVAIVDHPSPLRKSGFMPDTLPGTSLHFKDRL